MITAAAATSSRRTASRAERRQQLIDATMKCIARKGMSSLTLGDVAGEAGLSQGIVNLHFKSKDNLLTETLICLAGDYKSQFDKALEKAGPRAADKLRALIELDLRPSICDPQKIAVWFAFWGEVKSRPTYRRICDQLDGYYDEVIAGLCEAIIEEGRYDDLVADTTAEALGALTNGLWLSYLISPRSWDRGKALDAVASYLRGVFPKHYPT